DIKEQSHSSTHNKDCNVLRSAKNCLAWTSGILKEDSSESKGNFRAALCFRIDDGDEILQKHLEDHPGDASYIRPETQIEEIGELLQEQVVKEVAKAEFFSILVDGTTDFSVEEQLSISLRYILDGKLFEKFFGFVQIRRHYLKYCQRYFRGIRGKRNR
ncbi:hypothetical protein AVEN_3709-1, partial [Araneus ventricosus]